MTNVDAPGATLLRRFDAALLWAPLLPLMFLLRPYDGIVQDAWIYMGRGLADRDPSGLGQDILFTHDAQTGFSLFRPVVRVILAVLPIGEASMLLVLVGLLAWFIGAAALTRRIASGRGAWAAMVAVLAMPSDYGGFSVFHYAEAVATPRLFAEATVLFGLAMLLDGRYLLACGFLAAGIDVPSYSWPYPGSLRRPRSRHPGSAMARSDRDHRNDPSRCRSLACTGGGTVVRPHGSDMVGPGSAPQPEPLSLALAGRGFRADRLPRRRSRRGREFGCSANSRATLGRPGCCGLRTWVGFPLWRCGSEPAGPATAAMACALAADFSRQRRLGASVVRLWRGPPAAK